MSTFEVCEHCQIITNTPHSSGDSCCTIAYPGEVKCDICGNERRDGDGFFFFEGKGICYPCYSNSTGGIEYMDEDFYEDEDLHDDEDFVYDNRNMCLRCLVDMGYYRFESEILKCSLCEEKYDVKDMNIFPEHNGQNPNYVCIRCDPENICFILSCLHGDE